MFVHNNENKHHGNYTLVHVYSSFVMPNSYGRHIKRKNERIYQFTTYQTAVFIHFSFHDNNQ